ncbi:MAG: prenyltransferase [Rhodospirillales bacterium]|nr:prenyltransferase [Rhodospirillales bacterium]
MAEPTIAALCGNAPAKAARRYILATRPMFFSASVLPLFIGSAWGWLEAGAFNATAFFLALFSTISVHAAANVLNDVFDDINGNDRAKEGRIFPYTGGSRFIQNGVLDVSQMTRWGVALLILGALSGAALALYKGPVVICFGLLGVALGILYSAPPFSLSARGLGELAVGTAFGVLPVVGSAWLQSGEISLDALLLSVPISMWVTAILLINEVPDAKADAAVNRKTFIVHFGFKRARYLYLALHGMAFLSLVFAVLNGQIPLWGIAFPALIPIGAFKAARVFASPMANAAALRSSIEMTLGLHMLGSLWLVGVLLSMGFSW